MRTFVRRFCGRVGDSMIQCQTEGEGEYAGNGGDDERLKEEVGEGVGDDGPTVSGRIEMSSIRLEETLARITVIGMYAYRCAKSCAQTHLEIPLEISEDRDKDEKLVYSAKDAPDGEVIEQLSGKDQSEKAEQERRRRLNRERECQMHNCPFQQWSRRNNRTIRLVRIARVLRRAVGRHTPLI